MAAAKTKTRSNYGGRRPGAGRKPRGSAAAAYQIVVGLSPEEHAELEAGIRADPDGTPLETLTDVLREGGLALVRRRRPAGIPR